MAEFVSANGADDMCVKDMSMISLTGFPLTRCRAEIASVICSGDMCQLRGYLIRGWGFVRMIVLHYWYVLVTHTRYYFLDVGQLPVKVARAGFYCAYGNKLKLPPTVTKFRCFSNHRALKISFLFEVHYFFVSNYSKVCNIALHGDFFYKHW